MSKRARSGNCTPTKHGTPTTPTTSYIETVAGATAMPVASPPSNEAHTEIISNSSTTSDSQKVIQSNTSVDDGSSVAADVLIPNWPIRRTSKVVTQIIDGEDIVQNDSDSTSSAITCCPPTVPTVANHQLSDFWKISDTAAGGRDSCMASNTNTTQDSGAAGGSTSHSHTLGVSLPSQSATTVSNKRQMQFLSLKDMQKLNETIQNQCEVIQSLERSNDEQRGEIDHLRQQCEEARAALQHKDNQLMALRHSIEPLQSLKMTYIEVLKKIMIEAAIVERREARRREHVSHFELGKVVMYPFGNGPREVWSEGNKMRDLIQKRDEIKTRMIEVEALRKRCEKASKKGGIMTVAVVGEGSSCSNISITGSQQCSGYDGTECPMPTPSVNDDDTLSMSKLETDGQVQMCRSEYERLTKGLQDIEVRIREVDYQKAAFMKEVRRIESEDVSKFAMTKIINERYVMMNLLGKGGFAEVWRVFDVYEAKFCACKIHHISKECGEANKAHYKKHAERELEIMRKMNHQRLTKLYDVFYFDKDTFVSVLELSEGPDLDTILKRQSRLPEKEAKMVMIQLISALRHLAQQECPIIHYDLKPGNILFHSSLPSCLDIKVTDFGLSKVMMERNHADNPSIELTSQGTGTYWYLPPECFITVPTPRISTKVDIWSAGVIFYQMLYGKRPFAEGVCQRRIWSEQLIVSGAHTLKFPDAVPSTGSSSSKGPAVGSDISSRVEPVGYKVSEGAKSVIRACLEYDPATRIDIESLCTHSYFMGTKKKTSEAVSKRESAHMPSTVVVGSKPVIRPSDRLNDLATDTHNNNTATMPPPPAVRIGVNDTYQQAHYSIREENAIDNHH